MLTRRSNCPPALLGTALTARAASSRVMPPTCTPSMNTPWWMRLDWSVSRQASRLSMRPWSRMIMLRLTKAKLLISLNSRFISWGATKTTSAPERVRQISATASQSPLWLC